MQPNTIGMKKDFLKVLKKPKVFVSILVIIVIILVLILRGPKELDADFAKVEYSDLINEVNVTGRVEPVQEVDLGFERGGRVSNVRVKEGDKVYIGQVLVWLENGSIEADLEKAQAKLKAEEAVLAELKRGKRAEEIQIQETKVTNAKVLVREEKQALLDEIKKSFTTADDAIRNKADLLFSNPRGLSPQLIVPVSLSQLEIDVEFERVLIEDILNNWQIKSASLTTGDDLVSVGVDVRTDLQTINTFLEKMALAVNSLEVGASLNQTTIDSYQSDISTARININAAKSGISTDNEAFSVASSSLALEEKNLELMLAGSDPQKILVGEANVEGARADVKKWQAELRKTIIISPINGVVTRQDVRVGEIIAPNTTPISVISLNSLQIEVNVPETDIVDIAVLDEARVNLDAYGNDINFPAVVVAINPGEEILQGVPVYKTTLQFKKTDERIRPGMTADIFILADTKENVLSVPRRAVLKKDGREYVRLIERGEIVERDVETGFKDSLGKIEIVTGLSEGEEVIVFIEEK